MFIMALPEVSKLDLPIQTTDQVTNVLAMNEYREEMGSPER